MKRLLLTLSAVMIGLTFILSACEKGEEKTPPKVSSQDVKKEAQEAAGTAAQYAKQERDEFVKNAQKELDALGARVDEFKKQAQEATGDAKTKLDQQLKNLQEEQQVAEKKLADLKAASGNAWEDMKAGVEAAINHLKQSF
jgi:hypothetical protein